MVHISSSVAVQEVLDRVALCRGHEPGLSRLWSVHASLCDRMRVVAEAGFGTVDCFGDTGGP